MTRGYVDNEATDVAFYDGLEILTDYIDVPVAMVRPPRLYYRPTFSDEHLQRAAHPLRSN